MYPEEKTMYKESLLHFWSWRGRICRRQYACVFVIWFMTLLSFFIIGCVLSAILFSSSQLSPEEGESFVQGISALLYLFLLGYSLLLWPTQIKRFHDMGISGWWGLLGIFPANGIIIILCLFMRPKQEGNKYGLDPRLVTPKIN